MNDDYKAICASMKRLRRELSIEKKKNELWLRMFREAMELFALHRPGPFRHELHTEEDDGE